MSPLPNSRTDFACDNQVDPLQMSGKGSIYPYSVVQTTGMAGRIIRRDIDVLVRMLGHAKVGRRKHRIDNTGRGSSTRDRRCCRRRLRRRGVTLLTRLHTVGLLLVTHIRRARGEAVGEWSGFGVCVGCDVWLWFGRVFLPAPALFELLKHKGDAPACFLVDFGEDLEDFFLFASIGETLGGVGQRT